jgi:hypothetical protein
LAALHIALTVTRPFRQIFLNFVANLTAPVEIINKIQLYPVAAIGVFLVMFVEASRARTAGERRQGFRPDAGEHENAVRALAGFEAARYANSTLLLTTILLNAF